MPDPHFANTPAYFKEISSGDTPSSGQISLYAKTDGKMYYKDDAGVETEIGGGGGVTTSSTAPVSPSAGDLWFNSDNASLYIYYDDGDSQQWVSASWQTPNLGGGKVAQVVIATTSTTQSFTTVIPLDGTTPQNTEGTEILTVSITPQNAGSTLAIDFRAWGTVQGIMGVTTAVFRDSEVNALDSAPVHTSGNDHIQSFILSTNVSAGSTAAQTFKIRIGQETTAFSTSVNFLRRIGSATNTTGGKAVLKIIEILP